MAHETPTASDILSAFIADAAGGKHNDGDGALSAALLKHLLLQGGFKIVSREPGDNMITAGSLVVAPDEIWREMWDAAAIYETEENDNYVPA